MYACVFDCMCVHVCAMRSNAWCVCVCVCVCVCECVDAGCADVWMDRKCAGDACE